MRQKSKIIMLSIAAIIVALIVWGMIEPYLIEVEEETASIENLPPEWEGKELIAIGDFQVGMWLDNDSNLEDIVDEVISRSPEAVLLLGDYVYRSVDDRQEEMEKVLSYLKPLTESGIPVYAVLGNHDYNMMKKKSDPNMKIAEKTKEDLEGIDVKVLHNASTPLRIKETDQPLYLVGIGAHWPEEDNVNEAFNKVGKEAAKFVFMHNPNTFSDIPARQAPSSVAGHTHGGQFRVPFTPHWSWKDLFAKGEAHADGWVTDDFGADGNQLYVNRGIGVSLVPLRLNNFPEITEFHLKQAR
ncbi:metallophosphoesterase [Halobacillus mangrovi]|uniref:metallophosphoesterase n=1 Tax=Halobacillus mangrovi TaxID=402384 RepID=UPI003D99A173